MIVHYQHQRMQHSRTRGSSMRGGHCCAALSAADKAQNVGQSAFVVSLPHLPALAGPTRPRGFAMQLRLRGLFLFSSRSGRFYGHGTTIGQFTRFSGTRGDKDRSFIHQFALAGSSPAERIRRQFGRQASLATRTAVTNFSNPKASGV
jgi:hypothetical protein